MRRRTFLAGIAAVGLAGCAGRQAAGPTSPAGDPALAGADLQVRGSGCGRQVDEARVSFDRAGPAVAVDGTIWGADTCHTATLADATYDAGGDLLVVRVASVRRSRDGPAETAACGQCIVETDYAATCSFDGDLPGEVRVVHRTGDRRRVVATAER